MSEFALTAWADLSEEDHEMVRRVYAVRERMEAPLQSNFRVAAVFAYTDVEGKRAVMEGANNETCFIHGSICAERTAIPRIRMAGYRSIDAVYITCDGDGYITPGMLCREYMTEVCGLDLHVVLASGAYDDTPSGAVPHAVRVTTLAELYPFPPAYRALSRYDVLAAAAATADKVVAWEAGCDSDDSDDDAGGEGGDGSGELVAAVVAAGGAVGVGGVEVLRLLRATRKATERDGRDILHPIRYAAGVLFGDGRIATGAQTKALEYGATVNPVIKLAKVLEDAAERGEMPVALVMMDQFGVCHGPMADSRSFLHEGPWSDVPVLVHNTGGKGELVVTNVAALIPDSPRIEELFAELDGANTVAANAPHVPGMERSNTLYVVLGSHGVADSPVEHS